MTASTLNATSLIKDKQGQKTQNVIKLLVFWKPMLRFTSVVLFWRVVLVLIEVDVGATKVFNKIVLYSTAIR